jgi:hypothetical protein
MQGLLYEAESPWLFLFLTVILGGSAAFQTGRAVAQTWRPLWLLLVYAMLVAAAVRFLHYALFQETLISLQFYLTDTLVCLIAASIGYRLNRASQMARRYRWAYERHGPFGWRTKAASAGTSS